jgi:hypothetical protein
MLFRHFHFYASQPSTTPYIHQLPDQLSTEKYCNIYPEIGEIRVSVTNHIHNLGLTFTTYSIIGSAMKAVTQMPKYQRRGRDSMT